MLKFRHYAAWLLLASYLLDEARGLIKTHETGWWAHINVKLLHFFLQVCYVPVELLLGKKKPEKKESESETEEEAEIIAEKVIGPHSLIKAAWSSYFQFYSFPPKDKC